MQNPKTEGLLAMLKQYEKYVNDQTAKKLGLDQCERIITRLDHFSVECHHCQQYLNELESHIKQLKDNTAPNKADVKVHTQKIAGIIAHLQKQHKIVTEGYYLGIYMSLGTSLGLVFGLLLFPDNFALGLPIGIGTGVAIGAGLDADAKKKGLTL
ncbi:hypothetical protein [Radiobacillus sp. PE A8.2]|uniref:hypothetical protein n=1 Tax=Radiobacillus sp. PE A8.2 TaxID=3380349 RepID=UPI003890232B